MFFIGTRGLDLKRGNAAARGRQQGALDFLLGERLCLRPPAHPGLAPAAWAASCEPWMLGPGAGARPLASVRRPRREGWLALLRHEAFFGKCAEQRGGGRASMAKRPASAPSEEKGGAGPCRGFCPLPQPPAPSCPRRTPSARPPGCGCSAFRLCGGPATPGVVARQQAARARRRSAGGFSERAPLARLGIDAAGEAASARARSAACPAAHGARRPRLLGVPGERVAVLPTQRQIRSRVGNLGQGKPRRWSEVPGKLAAWGGGRSACCEILSRPAQRYRHGLAAARGHHGCSSLVFGSSPEVWQSRRGSPVQGRRPSGKPQRMYERISKSLFQE
ncbi:PREDICTED: uncharacterized protein LOC102005899 [Chinchilla lanigera]|uniref:uncharacterized protein LOC102005899 n=1 Tax=Chinchilla lanigera TaxID=34839 RepID=UPI00038EFB32|nr:PREDICTED: uncharacterized protein LOC102005899 [Chinchilla lanigera]